MADIFAEIIDHFYEKKEGALFDRFEDIHQEIERSIDTLDLIIINTAIGGSIQDYLKILRTRKEQNAMYAILVTSSPSLIEPLFTEHNYFSEDAIAFFDLPFRMHELLALFDQFCKWKIREGVDQSRLGPKL